ncbi:hypothetical protein [Lichenifustis flavocetrariae]|uniref:Uncharacterized protein n=1 Tax=Lichenifustis flavocetrariae TaxID=2949735 RepID=A0AA41YWD5_9HYPH|nr:hypothetical protein [Lichenifustis flavocetrariae]MCW6508456.1 hypothetical protein [Lichenifustis flavocetrariae]
MSRKNDENKQGKSPVTGDFKVRRDGCAPEKRLDSKRDKQRLRFEKAIKSPVNALNTIREDIKKDRRGFRNRRYQDVAVIMKAAIRLNASPKDYQEFVKLRFWVKAKRKPKGMEADDEILRWCLVFAFDARVESEIKRMRDYNQALMPLFDKKVDPETVPEILNECGGFEGLGDMATRYARQTSSVSEVPTLPSSESNRRSDPQPELDELDADDLIPTSVTLAVPRLVPTAAADKMIKPSKIETLDIDAEPELISEACNLAEGEEANLLIKRSGMLIKRSGMVGKSARFVAVSLRRASLSGRSG